MNKDQMRHFVAGMEFAQLGKTVMDSGVIDRLGVSVKDEWEISQEEILTVVKAFYAAIDPLLEAATRKPS